MWQLKIGEFNLYFVFYSFIIFSFFGWIYETTLVSMREKTFVNRGFLNGPLIPIYGFGGTIVYTVLYPVKENWLIVFFGGMLIATILEYITSFVMELIFHTRWWDYTRYKINLQGRIALIPSLFWGVLSIVDLYIFGEIVTKLIDKINYSVGVIGAYTIMVVGIADITVTTIYALQLNKRLESLQRIREEFATYIESTKIYGKSEGIRERIEQLSFSGINEFVKGAKEEIVKRVENKLGKEYSEAHQEEKRNIVLELEGRFKTFVSKYQGKTEDRNIVHKRLIKAFPHMKIKNRDHVLSDIRERVIKRK